MSTSRSAAAMIAAFILFSFGVVLAAPTTAAPQKARRAAGKAATATAATPFQYVHRGDSAKGEFTRSLSLFKNGRAVLVSYEADAGPATVQTGTWKRGNRADRVSITLTRQNGKPYQETILLIGTPGDGSVLSSIGESAKQYGAYGLTFAPRIANKVAVSYDNKQNRTIITAVGIKPVTLESVSHWQITADGYNVLFWKKGGTVGFENEGDSLYYFNTLTGKARRIAQFPQPIRKVSETRLSSGLPVWVVSHGKGETGAAGVAVVDPLRERTVKEWPAARLTGIRPGRVTITRYRAGEFNRANPRPVAIQTVTLDRFF